MNYLIIGVAGNVGGGIAKLLKQTGAKIWGIDVRTPSREISSKLESFNLQEKDLNPMASTREPFTYLLQSLNGIYFDCVIFATRIRDTETNNVSQKNQTSRFITMTEHFRTTVVEPFLTYQKLKELEVIKQNTVTILLGSTNALEVSQQSIGYGTAHAALIRAYKQFVLSEKNYIYLLLIGIIKDLDQLDYSKRSTMKEIVKVIIFLCESKIESLLGNPLVLSGGKRLSLDATAVHLGFFEEIFTDNT